MNMDSLLQDIHLFWDDLETNDIEEFQVKRLDKAESKEDPHVMLIDNILLEEKFRDGVLVFMNDRRDKGETTKESAKRLVVLTLLKKKEVANARKMKNRCKPLNLLAL